MLFFRPVLFGKCPCITIPMQSVVCVVAVPIFEKLNW